MDADRSYELYREGREAVQKGDLQTAIVKLKQSVSSDPHAKTCEALGECFLQTGELNDAILYLSAAAGLGKQPSRAKLLLAQAYQEAGRPVEAYQHVESALSMNPGLKAANSLREQLLQSPEVRQMIAREDC